jgi:hypothetical protein
MRTFGQEVWKAFAKSFGLLMLVRFDSRAYQVAVLRLFGWKCCLLWALAGVVDSPFQASGTCLRVLRRTCLFKLRLIAQSSLAHFCERLGSMKRDHSLTHQRIKTRNFQLINAQILKVHPQTNPSRHPSPRRASRRKLVFRVKTGAGRSPGPHAQRVLTAPYEYEGCHAAAPALQNFLSKNRVQRQGAVIAA